MAMYTNSSLDDFYQRSSASPPDGIRREVGHFNVFETENLFEKATGKRIMPYSRRLYYKISWLRGASRVEYADKVIDVQGNALMFATPKIPYHWLPEDGNQTGMFCIFTSDFLAQQQHGTGLEALPIFQPGQLPVFQLSAEETVEAEHIFRKMLKELHADYKFKYDLLRTLIMELIHFGQKLQPMSVLNSTQNASQRISSLFLELLERQYPLDTGSERLSLRSPKDFADRLAVHVNHLNKVLKETTENTTTRLIQNRLMQEAKIMLKQTDWSVAEIAYTLGFDDISHFSNYFKKQSTVAPLAFRDLRNDL